MLSRLINRLREYLWLRAQPAEYRWREHARVSEQTLRSMNCKRACQLPGWVPGCGERDDA